MEEGQKGVYVIEKVWILWNMLKEEWKGERGGGRELRRRWENGRPDVGKEEERKRIEMEE